MVTQGALGSYLIFMIKVLATSAFAVFQILANDESRQPFEVKTVHNPMMKIGG